MNIFFFFFFFGGGGGGGEDFVNILGVIANWTTFRGGTRISGKGVHVYKDVGVRFADFISFFSSIP